MPNRRLGLILKIALGLQAAFWAYNGYHFANLFASSLLWWMQILLLLNALVFLACIWLIDIPHPIIRIFIFTFLSVNALLSITDQLGVLDFIFLSINIMCIIGCAFYFKKPKHKEVS